MRVRNAPGEEIPGEPGDDRALSKMIDAPLGDRARWQPQWPETPDLFVPFGEGRTVRAGRDVTVVSYGRTLPLCVKAAEALAPEGIEAEVIDLRSLWPYDWARIPRAAEARWRFRAKRSYPQSASCLRPGTRSAAPRIDQPRNSRRMRARASPRTNFREPSSTTIVCSVSSCETPAGSGPSLPA